MAERYLCVVARHSRVVYHKVIVEAAPDGEERLGHLEIAMPSSPVRGCSHAGGGTTPVRVGGLSCLWRTLRDVRHGVRAVDHARSDTTWAWSAEVHCRSLGASFRAPGIGEGRCRRLVAEATYYIYATSRHPFPAWRRTLGRATRE